MTDTKRGGELFPVIPGPIILINSSLLSFSTRQLLRGCRARIMTEKKSLYSCSAMFGNMCIEVTHTESTRQPPTIGMRRVQAVYYVCANFHPFTVITDSSASPSPGTSSVFASVPISPLLSNCSHTSLPVFLLHLLLTATTASAYIVANLPWSSFFAIFSP